MKKVIRLAEESDMEQGQRNLFREREAKRICLAKIKEHKLPMKLIGVESFLDGSKIIFYFVSEGRVDFRALVKDLASAFKTRIEMRQVGVRNEAKMIGGLGTCGREFCCCSFLKEFEPVSVKMAKEQNLALNPQKISGACGRLMCCLAYEIDTYTELRKDLPKVGKRVVTPQGAGKGDPAEHHQPEGPGGPGRRRRRRKWVWMKSARNRSLKNTGKGNEANLFYHPDLLCER